MKTRFLIIIGVALTSLTFSQALGEFADLVNTFNYNKESCELLIFDLWQPTVEGKEISKKILDECVKRGFIIQELVDKAPSIQGYGSGTIAHLYKYTKGDVWKIIEILQDPELLNKARSSNVTDCGEGLILVGNECQVDYSKKTNHVFDFSTLIIGLVIGGGLFFGLMMYWRKRK